MAAPDQLREIDGPRTPAGLAMDRDDVAEVQEFGDGRQSRVNGHSAHSAPERMENEGGKESPGRRLKGVQSLGAIRIARAPRLPSRLT